MVDLSQILLVIVITALTILLSAIGIQIVAILRELKKTVEKVNKMLDDAGMVTEAVAHPIAGLGGALDGLRSGLKAVEVILAFFSQKKKKTEKEEGKEKEE